MSETEIPIGNPKSFPYDLRYRRLFGLGWLPNRPQFWVVVIALTVLANTLAFGAANAGGWSETDCAGITVHLFKVGGLGVDEQLILRLYPNTGSTPGVGGIQKGRWWDVQGERCSRDGKCDKIDSARLWLDRWSKRVSAKYEFDFGGKHLTGTFDVKNRRPKIACE